jgi:osmotically-inducible protein OsmY
MRKLETIGIGAAIAGLGAYLVRRSKRAGRAVHPGDVDDATLARKVESELAPRGRVSVNAANGVVQLRGEVEEPGLIEELAHRARAVSGVRDVENLLHLPGQQAPMHQ